MEETQIKQIIERQPLHGSALLDPRCKILLLVCIGFVSYFLAGEVVSLTLMLVYGLFIAFGNGEKWAVKMIVFYVIVKQRHGEVRFDGKKLTPRQRRSLSYLVMQDTDYQLFASSVEEELSLGMNEDCREKVEATLEALELSEYRERHPASLSGGQKQRVTIGAAIVKGSPVIYFDEPTSGLDYDSMVRVSNLIGQLSDSGVIVFVVSHDFEFIVRTCTEVVQLDDHGAIQNHRLSSEILKTLSEKYFK